MTAELEIDQSRRGPLRHGTLWLGRAISTFVYIYVIFVEIILLLGFLLLLGGADPTSSFVDWVYRSMDRAMQPFRGMFSVIELGSMPNEVESVFDASVLFAVIMYAILALVIHSVVDWLNNRALRLDREDEEYRRLQIVSQTLPSADQPTTELAFDTSALGTNEPSTSPEPPASPPS